MSKSKTFNYFITLFLITLSSYMSAQVPVTLKDGNQVNYSQEYHNYTQQEITSSRSTVFAACPDAIILSNPDNQKYNCSGFAFHKAEGFLGNYIITTSNSYLADGSYIIDNQHPTRIIWDASTVNHVAVLSQDDDWVVSKWGEDGCLVAHHKDHSIYDALSSDAYRRYDDNNGADRYTIPYVLLKTSGPHSLGDKETGTWYASAEIGDGNNYSYEWRVRTNFSQPFGSVLSTADSYSRTMSVVPFELQVKVTSGGYVDIDTIFVDYDPLAKKNNNQISTNLPTEYNLGNYPNPLNPNTNINIELPKNEYVRLSVYSMLGEEVATLVNKNMDAGIHSIPFDGSSLNSGTYIYRLQTNGFSLTKKMLLIK